MPFRLAGRLHMQKGEQCMKQLPRNLKYLNDVPIRKIPPAGRNDKPRKVIRQLKINNPPKLRSIFVCLRYCCEGRIASYVTETAMLKTDKKAHRWVGYLFPAALQSNNVFYCLCKQMI